MAKLKIRNETNTDWYIIGAQGDQGSQGYQGNQGVQGSQGSIGATGAQGNQGVPGQQGTLGSQGVQGAQGFQGSTGAQGAQGYQGQTGAQGSVGAQGSIGSQGYQGATGANGAQGFQGQTGAQGAQGNQGSVGATGATGIYGGNSQPYYFKNGYSNPTSGQTVFNNASFASVTQIKTHTSNNVSGDCTTWFDNFDISTNTIKGTLSVIKKLDANVYRVFDVTGNISISSNIATYSVTPIVTNGSLNDSDEVVLSYVSFGSIGATGAQGAQGATGAQGVTGSQGAQGATGNVGSQGPTGAQGNQGATGDQGANGAQGSQGATGSTGAQGSVGAQGNQGATGAQGATGLQGAQGATGSQGATGAQGAQGSVGAQGSTGAQGAQGAQGLLGDALAHAVTINSGGYFKVGTGTKDTNLYGFQIDDKEIVAQINGQDTSYISSSGEFMTKLGKIGGWTVSSSFMFDTPTISNCRLAFNSTSASIYARPLGADDATAFVMFGQTYVGGAFTGNYGISAIDGNGATIFRLDDSVKQIAGYNFDYEKFYIGTNSSGFAINTSSDRFLSNTSAVGFEIYDASSPKLFIGKRDGNYLDWNITAANKLTIKGEIISSKFSTGADFTETGSINFAKMQDNAFKAYDYISYSGHNYQARLDPYGLYVADLGNSPQWSFSVNAITRQVLINGYNVPKCFGVTDSPPTVNRFVGDTYIGTNNVVWIWNGSSWLQIS